MTRKNQIFMIVILIFTIFSFGLSIIKFFQKEKSYIQTKFSSFSDSDAPPVRKKNIIMKLTLQGVIHNDPYESGIYANQVIKRLRYAQKSRNIVGVIIELDSPGGEVGATKKIYEMIQQLRKEKPVVVFINDIAASGGYYIASACDRILARESAVIGSIGVITILPNVEELLKKIGISIQVLKAGKYKDFSYPFRNLTEEEEKMYKEVLETAYSTFISDVAEGRKQSQQLIKEQWAEGRIFSGKKAKALQMIDKIGGEKEAIRILKSMLKITKEPFIYEPKKDPFERLLEIFESFFSKPRSFFGESQLYYLYPNSNFIYQLQYFYLR